MRGSGENMVGNSIETSQKPGIRRLLNLLLAGILIFASAADTAGQSDQENAAKSRTCEEQKRGMFKDIKIVPDSKSKNNENKKKPKKEYSPRCPEKPCNNCKAA